MILAEPLEFSSGPPRPSDLTNGLLLGDQLLEVNGQSIERLNRDELLKIIKNCGQTIKLKVRGIPELAEACQLSVHNNVLFGGNVGDSLHFNDSLFNANELQKEVNKAFF